MYIFIYIDIYVYIYILIYIYINIYTYMNISNYKISPIPKYIQGSGPWPGRTAHISSSAGVEAGSNSFLEGLAHYWATGNKQWAANNRQLGIGN